MRGLKLTGLLVTLAMALATAGADEGETPRDIGLTEKAARRLVQIDVSISGPADVVNSLTREDFDLLIDSRHIDEFLVDHTCVAAPSPAPASRPTEPGRPARGVDDARSPPEARAAVSAAPVHYLFYFDQIHLTLEGRQRSLDVARRLIPTLIVDGSVATVVSSGGTLGTYVDRSGDPAELLAALDRLEGDHQQWATLAELEDKRIDEVYVAFDVDQQHAKSVARRYQQQERWETERALRRFAMVLGRLADVPPPKATVYFADTMRSNAGEHYMSLFRQSGDSDAWFDTMKADSLSAQNPFDRVIEAAGSFGVRLYTIQARGLVARSSVARGPRGVGTGGVTSQTGVASTQRLDDAKDSLVGLALETGGRAFLNGAPSRRIADFIREDLTCPLLISFDPEGLPEDKPLRVGLRVHRAGVEAHVRGQIVLGSAKKQRTARLMAAFAAPSNLRAIERVRGVVVPTGFDGGKYSALVQLAIPPSELHGAVWDVGASLVSAGQVRADAAGRIEISGPGVPVVFETEMEFPPGAFELAMVAHETTADRITAGQLEGMLPDPRDADATVGPLAVLQPAAGAFLRDGDQRSLGPLARTAQDTVLTDRPTAVVGLVCRNRPEKDLFEVHRTLEGESSVEFPTLLLEAQEERCTQVRDLIPTRMMTSGGFRYELRVTANGEPIVENAIEFFAIDPDDLEIAGALTGDVEPAKASPLE